jgi:hypothetical protein
MLFDSILPTTEILSKLESILSNPEDRVRDGGNDWSVERLEHTQHLLSSPSYMGAVRAAPK